jgi:hypothetical protein
MQHTSEWQRALRAAVASTLALSMGALGVASAEAATITPDSVSPSAHFTDCLSALFSDPAAHQQYCGTGNGGPLTTTTPSTLAPTSNDPIPAVPTCTYTNLQAPLFTTFKTATIDDSAIGSDFARHLGGVHVAYYCPPDPCQASLARPAFQAFELASIDTGLTPADFGQHFGGHRVAINCCLGSLGRPLFSTFGVATLDDALTVPATALGHDALVATPCPQ